MEFSRFQKIKQKCRLMQLSATARVLSAEFWRTKVLKKVKFSFGSAGLSVLILSFLIASVPVAQMSAVSAQQKEVFSLGIRYYDYGGDDSACVGGAAGDIISFAQQPIDSDWGVSDKTVEDWFLQQGGAQEAISRYRLNSGNIGEITKVVKEMGISRVFFYAYTVNEGGGAGGFINHFASSTSSGVNDAKRDAEYLADQSKIMDSKPAWVDAAFPQHDYVPQDVKDKGDEDFKSMPSGTIGRAYIPATAATTWEVYYPDMLKKEKNHVQNYGAPLHDVMENIKSMGGNLAQSGGSGGVCNVSTDFVGEDFVIYAQGDPQWGSRSVGGCELMSSCGCGVASIAMIITALTGEKATPDDMADFFNTVPGALSAGMSNDDTAPDAARHWGLKAEEVIQTDALQNDVDKINEVFKKGGLIWTCGHGANPFYYKVGHCIVIRGLTADGQWSVGDPTPREGNKDSYDSLDIVSRIGPKYGSHSKIWAIYRN